MKEKCMKAYVWGNIFMKESVRKVLIDRKGATTIEYVAVLAGAAALGGIILATVKGKDGVGKVITDKIKSIVNGIKTK